MEIFFLAVASVAQDILFQLGRGNAESIILFKRKIEIDKSLFIYSLPLGAKISYFLLSRFFYLQKIFVSRVHVLSFRAKQKYLGQLYFRSPNGNLKDEGAGKDDKYSLNRMINIVDTVTRMRQREKGKWRKRLKLSETKAR